MKTIQAHIESKQYEFINHPFFAVLKNLNSLEEINYFVPELTFWAMTFQDILRMNEDRVKDPFLRKIARHHRLEDAGHEQWFMHDKQYMNKSDHEAITERHDIAWLYSKDSEMIRDAAYAVVSEIYRIDNEYLNIALLLTLESSGHIFFEEVVKQVEQTGEDENLLYFSSSHLEVEKAHAMFEEAMERKLYEKALDIETRRKALQMIDRCYEAFSHMFDGLVIACEQRIEHAKTGVVREQRTVDLEATGTL